MHSSKSEIRLTVRVRAVCKGCTERHVGCHGRCKRFAEAKAEAEQKKAVIDAAASAEYDLRDYTNRHIDARMRKENWGK